MRAALVALGLLALLGLPSLASAHSLDFGVLRVTETRAGAELLLRAAGHEGTPPDVTLALEGPCALEAAPRRSMRGDRVEVRAQCRGALEGTTVRVDGMDDALTVAIRIDRLDDTEQAAMLDHASPQVRVGVSGDPVFVRYLRLGAEHLGTGLDHLLFLFALLLLVLRGAEVGRARALALAISGFTLGHSATLAAQVLGGLSLASAPVEACIALSIVFLAAELARPPRDTLTQRHPALVAAAFGLLHGLGFAGALTELGWPARDAGTALLAFNLGIELAQLAFAALAYPLAVWLTRRRALRWPAYALGATAAFWTLSRIGDLII